MVAGEEGERHWAYWENQLAGPLPVLDLPTDFPRPAPQSFRGATRHFDLEPELTAEILALCEARGVSLYAALLAAFQVLLVATPASATSSSARLRRAGRVRRSRT